MKKRISAMLLAVLMTITSLPIGAAAAQSPYCVELSSASDGKSVSAGDAVTVTIPVSATDDMVTAYNAYDLKLHYDAERLSLTSCTAVDSGAEIEDTDGRIRVKGYGDEKSLSTATVTLVFTAIKPGEAQVSITSAKIDISQNAGMQNAPTAATPKDTVTFNIGGYRVQTDGDGIVVEKYVAATGEDFTFRLDDHKNYDYELTVTIDGVVVTKALKYDEETGTYTIPGTLLDGSGTINITANRLPKEYKVTITGKDVAGEKTAVYNTDYTFKLDREEGYLYTVEITIGGETYTGYTLEEDTYTIPGADITGEINIKVTKTEDDSGKVTVTFAGSGAKDGKGDKKTLYGVEYPFKVNKRKGYTYSVTVYVEGKRVPYDYDYELDTYYILSENATGNITIVITKVATVEVNEYITLDKQSMYLIVYNGYVQDGHVPKYDGQSMYWSDRYNAYAWLIVSAETEKKVKTEAEKKITVTEGLPAGTVDYSGNANMTLQTDIADATLAHEMYNAEHSLSFMEMQKFLNADVFTDKKINVRDAAGIVQSIP